MGIDLVEREELNKTEIERLLEELKTSIIGFENYKHFFDKVKNSDQVILTQIENLVREYREYKAKFQAGYDKESHKNLMEDGFVKLEVFEDSRMMNKVLLEAYNWKTLQEELYSIIFQKIYRVLDDARALDIKRDALKEMREMDEKRNALTVEIFQNMSNMFRDTVITKLQNYDDKFINLVMMMDEDDRRDRKEIFDTLKKIVNGINVIEVKKRESIVNEIGEDNLETKKERMEKKFPKQEETEDYMVDEVKPKRQIVPNFKTKANVKVDDIDKKFSSFDDKDDDDDDDDEFTDEEAEAMKERINKLRRR